MPGFATAATIGGGETTGCTVQPPVHCTVQPRTVLYSGKKAVAPGHKYLRGAGQMMIIRVIVTRGCVTHRGVPVLVYCTWYSFTTFPYLDRQLN